MSTIVICQKEISIYEHTQLQCELAVIKVQGDIGDYAFADQKCLKNVYSYGRDTKLGIGVLSYCRRISSNV